jgi:ABC-type tungstate transport system permease subunit
MKKLIALTLFMLIVGGAAVASAETRIRMASTTSTQNSGLFDYLLPIFEKKTGIKIDVVAVGTGAAIEIGKRGDADLVFVHAKEQELQARTDERPCQDQGDEISKRCFQKNIGIRFIICVAGRQIRDSHQGACSLEKSGHRADKTKMVSRSRTGDGKNAEDRKRETGLHPDRSGHLACHQGQGQT